MWLIILFSPSDSRVAFSKILRCLILIEDDNGGSAVGGEWYCSAEAFWHSEASAEATSS